MTGLQVHVISVTYNSASTLEAFAAGLRDQGDRIGAVTVVDNGSEDGSAGVALAALISLVPSVRVIEQGNRGFAGGYAAAVQGETDGLYVLCVNPDVRLAPGAVDDMLRVLEERSSAAIVTTPLVDSSGGDDTATRRSLPRLGGSMLYSVLGRHTPARWRYNARTDGPVEWVAGLPVSLVEATTGALMLLAPAFRDIRTPVFDTDYWMYGEDLQLCADAASAGLEVLVVERAASLHLKGASSGRPRSLRSNAAFHQAMRVYVRKNLLTGSAMLRRAVDLLILLRFIADEIRNQPAKLRKRHQRRVRARFGLPGVVT